MGWGSKVGVGKDSERENNTSVNLVAVIMAGLPLNMNLHTVSGQG